MFLLLDLDNTLVDRDRAFPRWARALVSGYGGDEADLDWLILADAKGYLSRAELAEKIGARFSTAESVAPIIDRLRYEFVELIEYYAGVFERLKELKRHGTTLVIVTNETVAQQTMKLQHTGLDSIVDATVISEGVV